MAKKLELKKVNEEFELRSFKEPKTDINDNNLAKKQLAEFLALDESQKTKWR